MAKSYVNLDTRIDSFTDEFNSLANKVGDIALMSTSGLDSDVVGGINNLDSDLGTRSSLSTTADQNLVVAINEIDAELGTITAAAMGTTASTVGTAIAELDSETDSDNANLEYDIKIIMLTDGVSSQVTATANNSANETVFPAFVDGATGAQGIETDTGLTYNPSTGLITTTSVAAATINVSGIITGGGLTVGSAVLSEAELEILDGANVTTAELNIMDGGTSASSTTVADADRVVLNDAGTMKQVAVTDLAAYFDDEITAMPNLITTAATTVGALDAGSITSNFGTINTGASTITTTGLISGGSLDIDNVLINGTTIGHTDDTDLITLANGLVTVAGEVSVTTLDIGGTNIAATAAELNIMDGGTSGSTVTVVDADRFVMNDGGVMKQVNASFLKAYFGVTAGSLAISSLDIDGSPDIGAAIVDADLFIIDDGAGGTNRKATAARLLTYTNAGTLTAAAQTNITSLGRLDSAQIDDIKINGSTISTLSGTDLNITPLAGQQIVLDGTIVVDAGVVTGATSITSTAFVGNVTGTASLATAVTVSANNTANENVFITHVDGATGTQGLETDTTLKYNPSTGIITTTGFAGELTGNASTATTLATARAFTTSGDVVITSTNFDGSANFSAAATIQASAVETSMIAADAVTGAKIPDNAINSEHYADGSIDTAHIAADQIVASLIADNAIDTEHYADGSLEFAHMQNVAANSILGRNANSSGVLSEVALATTQLLIGDGTGFTAAALSGDVTMTNAGVVTIGANKIDQGMISDDVISGAEMKDLRTFTLKDSGGTTLFTMFGAGDAT